MCSLRDLLRDLEIQSAASTLQSVDFTVILATVYVKKSFDLFRSKNKSGMVIIVPVEKGIVDHVGMGDAYRFDFEMPAVD